ncbi:hypothetical protein ABIB15_002657 [Marisediminicola sp. UYEF4]
MPDSRWGETDAAYVVLRTGIATDEVALAGRELSGEVAR